MKITIEAPRLAKCFSTIFCLAIIGGLCSIYLSSLSFFGAESKLCELFGSDCNSVINTQYGKLFELPVSLLGISYSLVIIISELFTAKNRNVDTIIMTAVSGAAFFGSIFFSFVMLFVIKQTCIVCYTVHATNTVLFALYLLRLRKVLPLDLSLSSLITGIIERSYTCFAPALIALLLIDHAYLATSLQKERKKLDDNVNYYLYLYEKSKLTEIPVEVEDEIYGEQETASIKIMLIYKDGCPHCVEAKKKLTALFYKNIGTVCLIFKNKKHSTKEELQSWGIQKVPAVIIDDHPARGWDSPGFLNYIVDNCDC